MSEPLIDILMATYNGVRFIGEQIESIQSQTYKNWRLLVSDDCSSDGTLDVVRRYAARDDRISIVSEGLRYGGAMENFFALMSKSDAPYCMFSDQDDVWLPRKIENEYHAAAARERLDGPDVPIAVYTDMAVVDARLHEISPSFLEQEKKRDMRGDLRAFITISGAAGCTMLFNRALRNLVAGSDCSLALMHDWWIGIVAASCGALLYLDEPSMLYRQHSNNEVGAVSYSFWRRAVNFSESREKYWLSCKQAEQILINYGQRMNPENRSLVKVYANQLHASSLHNLLSLQRHSLLKKKAGRRFAQILTLLLGAPGR